MEFWLWFLVFWAWFGFGITLVYHRTLAHKAVKLNKAVEYFFFIGGYAGAFQGSPGGWVAQHRQHHLAVDTPFDPHSPRFGYFKSLIGWLWMSPISAWKISQLARDVLSDPFYSFLGKEHFPDRMVLNVTISTVFRGLILLLFGWSAFWASLLAGAVIFWSPLLLNLICHLPWLPWTYKVHESRHDAVNVPWYVPFSFGEALHDAHHAWPSDANNALLPGELDPTFWLIWALAKIGLAKYKPISRDVSKFSRS